MQKVSVSNVFKLSGAYIAYLIGSGFATGQEVMQFFASFGIYGIFAAIVSALLFCFLGSTLMMKGHDLQLEQPGHIFKYYCGNILGTIIEYFTILFLFSIVVITIAGTGAVVAQQFHLPNLVGILGMGFIAMITVILGLRKLVDIIGTVGPVIVVLTIGICLVVFLQNIGKIPSLNNMPHLAEQVRPTHSWWQSGALFFCYNILAGTIFFTQLGRQSTSKREAGLTAFVGASGLMLTVVFMILAMLAHAHHVFHLQVPVLYLGKTISPIVAVIFSVCILLGIYSTTAPMFWLVKNEFLKFIPKSFNYTLTVALGIIFILCGMLPFDKLVSTVYPFTGYVGALVVIAIFLRTLWNSVVPSRSSSENG
ncbi:hypothetical protein CD039_08460 [Staphylococcus argensis]|uniref:Branched-chain amino acid transport system II carrier protein n=1 Tax=Staphylococcus argensis TaxID=1607738 RepID=A0A2K4FCJ2_9STAP|nr:hypothetical protein [Staphylococcus argensis]POA09007.1 hypothetical protein CD039_08460 [Staphylococcus argensis]